jgi:hypothetical protein
MADYTTTYEAGLGRSERVQAHNAGLLAQQALRRRGARTPEFYFPKSLDNSRLILTPDPARVRQIRFFSSAITILFLLTMLYGFQHFCAIEKGYRVESEKQALAQLREENRQLRLSEAMLTDPGRIDQLARAQGFVEPQPGQMVRPAVASDNSAPALAMVMPESVASSY